jgi:hypothetical protein
MKQVEYTTAKGFQIIKRKGMNTPLSCWWRFRHCFRVDSGMELVLEIMNTDRFNVNVYARKQHKQRIR